MKLTLLLLFVTVLTGIAADSYSQSTKLTLKLDNVRIEDLLNKIEDQSQFRFFYNEEINLDKKVSIDVSTETIVNILEKVFSDKKIQYEIVGRQIILSNGIASNNNSTQQQKSISGKVTDSTGSGLPGVSVVVKGTTTGVITDMDGKYTLAKVPEKATLQFSFVGMKTQELVATGKSSINVTMQEEAIGLEEVVAVGYGTTKKSDLTGSVASVKSDQLVSYPTSGAVQSLQGRAAGVQITSNNGDPGGTMRVRVRGGTSINASSEPIYVVDGFVGGILPPSQDIESVEVLKDASATAIYGSRGANGVVMITTKKGTKGKTKIEFNSSYSSQKEINRLDLLNASQFVDYTKEVIPTYISGGANTDWQDMIFRNGSTQDYQLSFTGGTENLNYYLSGTYYDQNGIILGSSFNRYSVTSNIDLKVSDKLMVGLNIFGQRSGRDGILSQENSGGTENTGVLASAFKFMPDLPVYNTDGSFTVASLGNPIDNPYAVATQRKDETLSDLAQGNFYFDYKILNGLSFKSTFGASFVNSRQGQFIPTTLNQGNNVGGQAEITTQKNTNISNENYLKYTKQFGKNKVDVLAGYSFQKSTYSNWDIIGQKFTTNSVSYWNLGGASVIQTPSSSISESQLSSVYGRLNYAFNDRYLLTFNSRYDGSSNFSKNNKWAFFPSGAFAWNINKEHFMESLPFISLTKLRLSYGIVGNQAIGPYQTLARFSNAYTILNGQTVNAVVPTTVANDNLTWETSAQFDAGIDFGFLNNRFNFTADYYNTITSNLLFNVPLPQYSGYSTQLKNAGKVKNSGIEFTLTSKILTGKIKWNMDLNVSANRNKVLELPDGKDILYSSAPGHMIALGNTQILRVGSPVGSFYGMVYDGVYQSGDTFIAGSGFETTPGGEKYRDVKPDKVLNADDRTIIGNPQPKFFYGWNNYFSWKNFDLTMFVQGSYGNDILSYTLLELETLSDRFNSTTRALDRWTTTHTSTDVPMRSLSRSQRVSSRWIFDGSYVRLKNVTFGYNLPKTTLDKLKIQRLRIYVSAQNIFTITNYRGYDPEVNYNQSNANVGLDYGSYPTAKSFTLGVNLGF